MIALAAFLTAAGIVAWRCRSEWQYVEGRWCTNCDNVHAEEEKCPRELKRWCMDCSSFRILDRYFRCGTCKSTSVVVILSNPNQRQTVAGQS